MDGEAEAEFFGYGRNFAQEGDEVCSQVGGGYTVVFRDQMTNRFAVVGRFGTGKTGDNCLLEIILARLGQGGEAGLGSLNTRFGVACGRAGPLEKKQIVSGEIDGVETEGIASGGETPLQVGSRPVDDRHEVVADDFDARFGDGGERIFPGTDEVRVGARPKFDGIVDGNALHDRPVEASRANLISSLADFVEGPGLAAIEMVQGRDDSGGSGLLDVLERNRIGRPKPSPSLLHDLLGYAPS